MHREYFYKDNRDYLFHQQVEIVEFEVKKVQRQLDLAMRKMHHLKQDLFYYVKEQEFIYKMNEAKSEK